jgi:ABC-type glycerol-3-phosphate transport system permease component
MLDFETAFQRAQISQVMKYSLIVVASLPMLIIYPFVQKYFVKGVMIGAIKG